jgi:hypothetical protein
MTAATEINTNPSDSVFARNMAITPSLPAAQPARTTTNLCFFPIGLAVAATAEQTTLQVMPDDHSELVPPLPIPNRTVKRLCADDSAATSVKVGHRQAVIPKIPLRSALGDFFLCAQLSARTLLAATTV